MQWSSPLARIRLPQLLTAALGAQHERYESISIFFNSGFSE
jgi:hypothetical protein